jgi:glycosyltransferase involved in cell wall biosynthesis
LKPRVGVGILNYNGAALTIECLDHLAKVDWPADRLDIVVVDNGSSDDSVDRIRLRHPEVKLVTSSRNLGFAGGSNLAIQSMTGVDYVALLNNDALVDPGWLEPLVETCPKILFATTYIDLVLESETFRPIGTDMRTLGVRLSGVQIGSDGRMSKCHFPTGFWPAEPRRGV